MEIVTYQPDSLAQTFLLNFTSQNTRISYLADLKCYFEFCKVNNSNKLDMPTVIRFRDDCTARGEASASVNRRISTLKSFAKWCHEQGALDRNLIASIRTAKVVQVEPTLALSDEEAYAILNANPGTSFIEVRNTLILSLLLNLGLRRSEIANIKLNSISEYRGESILKIVGKGDKERSIPINAKLRTLIYNYTTSLEYSLECSDFLIQASPNNKCSKSFNPTSIYRVVTSACKKLGINKRISPHSCRATMISHLLEKGVSPRHVADLAGHSNINTTTSIYDKKRNAIKDSPVDKVEYGF